MAIGVYELNPHNQNQKSFYGKAKVYEWVNHDQTLKSYDTYIVTRKPDGQLVRHWNGWSPTTGKHIYAFCGLHKKEFMQLPYEERGFLTELIKLLQSM